MIRTRQSKSDVAFLRNPTKEIFKAVPAVSLPLAVFFGLDCLIDPVGHVRFLTLVEFNCAFCAHLIVMNVIRLIRLRRDFRIRGVEY